jgi:hypothetical protein
MTTTLTARRTFAVAITAALLAFPVQAKRDFGQIFIECGLGGLMAPQTQWAAVVTNVTWDAGTTAITSESSSPESCKGGQAKTAMMIYEAFPTIETELAQGRGEHLDALITLAGRSDAERAALIASLRAGFAKTVAEPEYASLTRYERAAAFYDLFVAVVAATPAPSA